MSTDDSHPDSVSKADAPQEPSLKEKRIAELREADRIAELRDRLYARGSVPAQSVRHTLPRQEIHDAPPTPPKPPVAESAVEREPSSTPARTTSPHAVQYSEPMTEKSSRKRFRKILLIIGVVFFVGALAVSSLLMLSGSTVSGENISLTVNGPLTVGGGQEMQFQVSVQNQNTVPIQSATLIIEYPEGTQSVTEDREVRTERQSLDTIATGEIVNVPLTARLYGKENEEKEIKVRIEYRVAGSNAIYDKSAEPLKFTISTAPIVMNFDTLDAITSGQELELALIVQSNSPSTLNDILVKATYPDGFDFSSAKPDTVSGEDVWKINELKPNEKKTIIIRGLLTGYENDVRRFGATAGVANQDDAYTLASQLASTHVEVGIEQPFLDIGVNVNGSTEETVIVDFGESVNVRVGFKNVLDNTIYDGKVFVQLEGNALNEFKVVPANGFYDSTNNTITWDSVDEEALREILPGRSHDLLFTLDPKNDTGSAPELKFTVTAEGQRTREANASQKLVGTASRTIRIESTPEVSASVLYGSGPFTNTGPTPPVAEKVTQYTFVLKASSGTNDLTGAEVTAVLPQYVSWLDLVSSGSDVTYNSTTRTMKWVIGDMDANAEKEVSVQVAFKPSLSQVETTPTILEAQRFKATDRFTGTVVRTDHPALTTSLFSESDDSLRNGQVRASE